MPQDNAGETTQESPNLIAVRRTYESGTTQGAHWHSNASELVYCLSGSGHVEITLPSGHDDNGRVPGEVEIIEISTSGIEGAAKSAFIPPGYLHDIVPGIYDIEVMIIFNSGTPDTFEKKFVFSENLDA